MIILLPLEKLRVPDLEVSEYGSKTFFDESNSLDKEYFDCIAEVVKSLNWSFSIFVRVSVPSSIWSEEEGLCFTVKLPSSL